MRRGLLISACRVLDIRRFVRILLTDTSPTGERGAFGLCSGRESQELSVALLKRLIFGYQCRDCFLQLLHLTLHGCYDLLDTRGDQAVFCGSFEQRASTRLEHMDSPRGLWFRRRQRACSSAAWKPYRQASPASLDIPVRGVSTANTPVIHQSENCWQEASTRYLLAFELEKFLMLQPE